MTRISAAKSRGIKIYNSCGIEVTTSTHLLNWTERRASLNAYEYFYKHYGVNINAFGKYLPYHQTK